MNAVKLLVAKDFDISIAELDGKGKQEPIATARLFCYALGKLKGMSANSIAVSLNRDHTAVLKGVEAITGRIEIYPHLKARFDAIKQKLEQA